MPIAYLMSFRRLTSRFAKAMRTAQADRLLEGSGDKVCGLTMADHGDIWVIDTDHHGPRLTLQVGPQGEIGSLVHCCTCPFLRAPLSEELLLGL